MCVFWSYLSEKNSDMARLRPYNVPPDGSRRKEKHHSITHKNSRGIYFRKAKTMGPWVDFF